jgi:4-carboxymuconolactone decarboxylase
MSRLPMLRPHELSPEQADVYTAIMRRRAASGQGSSMQNSDGSLRGPFNVLLHAPHVGRQVSDLGEAVRFDTSFTARERELVTLAVAAWHHSAFEWYAHTRLGRAAGLSDAEIEALERGDHDVFADDVERQLLRFVAESLSGDLSDETYAQTIDRCGTERTVELAVLIGYYELLARVLEVFRVSAPQD